MSFEARCPLQKQSRGRGSNKPRRAKDAAAETEMREVEGRRGIRGSRSWGTPLVVYVVALAFFFMYVVYVAGATRVELRKIEANEVHEDTTFALLGATHRNAERKRVLKQQQRNTHHHLQQQQHDDANPALSFPPLERGDVTLYTIADIAERAVSSRRGEPEPEPTPPPRSTPSSRLHGSISGTGYYAMDLALGTPPQTFRLIVDTGSTIAYVPCAFCGEECGLHIGRPFQPSASSTSDFIGCVSATCATFCGTRRCGCRPALEFLGKAQFSGPRLAVCSYERRYQEHSSSEGILVRDVCSIPGLPQAKVGFGCELRETGMIKSQNADGVVGFGSNPSGLVNQLSSQGAIDASFAVCMGEGDSEGGGGALFLGQSSIPATLREPYAWAKIQQSPGNPEFYAVGLRGIELGGGRVNVPWREYERGYGSVVDTGTTFLYLPDAAHRSFLQLLGAHLDKRRDKIRRTRSPNPIYPEDLCFEARDPARVSREEVVAAFPPLSVEMAGTGGWSDKIKVEFPAENYLFAAGGATCVGVYSNGNEGTLLGAVLLKNFLVNFDLKNQRIGFAKQDCGEL